MSIKSGAYGGIGPLRSQHSSSMNQASPNIPPTPYLDVMSVRNTHIPQDGIEETRKLIFDPVLIPDLEHTGVRPSMDLEDRLLFYPSGCKNCNLQRNIQNRLRHASSTDQEHTDGGLRAVQDDGVTGGRGMAALGRAGLRSGVRLKLQKQPPNRVSLTPYEKGLGESSVVVSQHAESVDKGSKLLYLVRSPPRQEGRYDLNGVKTLRKKPTSDQEAKQLVRSLQTTSHQMSLLVFDEV